MVSILIREISGNVCPICKEKIGGNLGSHIRKEHGDGKFKQIILEMKKSGMPDSEIGERFNINFKQLEKIITEAYGINISVLSKPKKIRSWMPRDFKKETTTVWSFKQRGNWATHDGRYRGNWSPYIPRNIILKYSKYGDIVLDYFVGGGTTAIEAKLLGRRCIALDLNPAAVALTKENLMFKQPEKFLDKYHIYEPKVSKGDARFLSHILSESIDLICAHPPYAGIINYSTKIKGDLSGLSVEEFILEMEKVAKESYRVLKPNGKCAILIGDTRKKKHVIPIGFQIIDVFLNAGFNLKELVIKRQHNCKTTGFWFEKSIKYNFLLLAHEYLAIFQKPSVFCNKRQTKEKEKRHKLFFKPVKLEQLETTTVWIFDSEKWFPKSIQNLIERYKAKKYKIINEDLNIKELKDEDIIILICKDKYSFEKFSSINEKIIRGIRQNGYLAIISNDIRLSDNTVYPLPVKIEKYLRNSPALIIKEIVIISIENDKSNKFIENQENLKISHKYLLVYCKKE